MSPRLRPTLLVVLTAWLPACDGDDDDDRDAGARDAQVAGDGGSDGGPDGGAIGCREDRDGDGFGSCLDCDDEDPDVSPGANEGFCCSTLIDDGIDNDCDGLVDETPLLRGCTCLQDDADGDGYLDDLDCEPEDGSINPGVTEGYRCLEDLDDGIDNDCDDEVDEATACDRDGDGVGADQDCDDEDYAVSPGRTELCCPCGFDDARQSDCDRHDNDCDDEVDEEVGCDCNAPDADRDGYREGDDCNDGDPSITPGTRECCCPPGGVWQCDELDNDCDGEVDEATEACCPI